MKKNVSRRGITIFLLSAVVALLATLVCEIHCDKAEEEPANDTITVTTGSVSIDSAKIALSVAQQPASSEKEKSAAKAKPVTSPDLKWARVQGPVKTISETISQKSSFGAKSTHKNVMRFDVNGKYIPDHPKNKRVVRNKKGQIDRIEETDHTEWGDIEYVYSYTYNKDGFVKSELETIDEYSYIGHSYTLNEKGWIVKEESGGHYECTIEGKATYAYSNIDAYGNWQKCVEKSTNIVCTDKSTTTTTITRKITYWK